MGRVVDYNGNASNPSEVSKLQIVNDDGFINPLIEWWDMTQKRLPNEANSSPPFRELVSISPALEHLLVLTNDGAVVVGAQFSDKDDASDSNNDSSPFGKSYKIRIRSKKTNKKFDINVHFKKVIDTKKTSEGIPKGYKRYVPV